MRRIGPDGAAVRPDRSADDDLDDGAEGALSSRRLDCATRGSLRPGAQPARPGRASWTARGVTADRRARRDRGARLARAWRAITRTRRRPRRPRRMAGITPATSAISMQRISSIIVDRAKDMIITGGFNVYSIEVEQALAAHRGGPGLRRRRPAGSEMGRARRRRRAATAGRNVDVESRRRLRQAADRQRENAQADRSMGRAAALKGRQSVEIGSQSGASRPLGPQCRSQQCDCLFRAGTLLTVVRRRLVD